MFTLEKLLIPLINVTLFIYKIKYLACLLLYMLKFKLVNYIEWL